MTFGARLRAARKAKQLTQKELAVKIKAAHNSISNWENNQNMSDPDTIQNLCWALDVEPNYFFSTEGINTLPSHFNPIPPTDDIPPYESVAYSTPTLAKDHVDLSSEDIELIEKFHRLDRRSQILILDMVNHELENELFYEDLFKDSDIFEAAVEEAKRELLRQRDDWDD